MIYELSACMTIQYGIKYLNRIAGAASNMKTACCTNSELHNSLVISRPNRDLNAQPDDVRHSNVRLRRIMQIKSDYKYKIHILPAKSLPGCFTVSIDDKCSHSVCPSTRLFNLFFYTSFMYKGMTELTLLLVKHTV
jgi:hypothetical protein